MMGQKVSISYPKYELLHFKGVSWFFIKASLHGIPNISYSQTLCPLRNIGSVHCIPTDFQDTRNIAKMFFRTTIPIELHLFNDYILWSGEICFLIRKHLTPSSPGEFSFRKGCFFCQNDIYF